MVFATFEDLAEPPKTRLHLSSTASYQDNFDRYGYAVQNVDRANIQEVLEQLRESSERPIIGAQVLGTTTEGFNADVHGGRFSDARFLRAYENPPHLDEMTLWVNLYYGDDDPRNQTFLKVPPTEIPPAKAK